MTTELTEFPSLFDRVMVITGPTASGKSELAVRVGEAMACGDDLPDVEIISLDSIAIYRGMDIGSAKPTPQQRSRIVHHLIDIARPDQEHSVAEYLSAAHTCVRQIVGRGKLPLFVGGTPMYLKAILKGFRPGPPADTKFRADVAADVQTFGVGALRERLWQVDPLSAARIDPMDVRRMTRALEFAKQTGVPISHSQTQFERDRPATNGLVFSLHVPRAVLHQRIQQRVTKMMSEGLVEEVRRLQNRYAEISKTARMGVGYREIIDATREHGDDFDVDHVAEQILFHTRRLARRQETWFRSFSEIRSVPTHRDDTPESARDGDALVNEILLTVRALDGLR